MVRPVVGEVQQSFGLLDCREQISRVGVAKEQQLEVRCGSHASTLDLGGVIRGLLKPVCACPRDFDTFGFQPREPAPEHPTSDVGSPVVLFPPIAR